MTQIRVRWDDQSGVMPGWFAEIIFDDRVVSDSEKVWFPVDLDDFGIGETEGLLDAIALAYPEAEIVIR